MKSSEKEYIAESEEILDDAVNCLLKIQESHDREADPSIINALFRDMHTLKGLSGLYDHAEITEISHSLESLLDDVRLGRIKMSDEVIAFIFKYVDFLRAQLERLKKKRPARPQDISGQLKEIELFRQSLAGAPEEISLEGVLDEEHLRVLSQYEEHRLRSNIQKGRGVYFVKTAFPLTEFDTKLRDLAEKMKEFGELVSTMPTSEKVPDGHIGFKLLVGSRHSLSELKEALGQEVDELKTPRSMADAGAGQTVAQMSEGFLKSASTTVRVDISRLDGILSTIEELSLAERSLGALWTSLTEMYGHVPVLIDLYRVRQSLQRKLALLQGQVLEIRMVPIGQIFGRMGQVVRRYSRKVGKSLELQVFGEDTEIDKYLAEEIVDPLVHIVRNAIDHGIESPDERKAAGKRPAGAVRLRAFQRGNNVVVEVEDDGRGIDVQKLRQKAEEKGLIERSAEPEEKELLDLLFTPGFSTRDTVSEVSGRGVGLDIVKEKISRLGAVAEVVSERGVGTTVSITLPITLALIKALMVRVGEERYAIPLSAMSETFAVESSSIQTIEKRQVCNLRGEMLPIRGLREFLGLPAAGADRSFAVVVGLGERRMGLLVDELLGQSSVVVKSLGGYFEGFRGFAGAAEIEEKNVVLVLDVESVIDESLSSRGAVHV